MLHTSRQRRETPEWFSQEPPASQTLAPISFVTSDLAISGIDYAASPELLRQAGIHSIVSLVSYNFDHIPELSASKTGKAVVPWFLDPEGGIHPDLIKAGIEAVWEIPLRESAQNRAETILRAIEAIEHCRSIHPPALVHCLVGLDRSPGLVAAYLANHENITFKEALSRVAQVRRISLNAGYAFRLIDVLNLRLE